MYMNIRILVSANTWSTNKSGQAMPVRSECQKSLFQTQRFIDLHCTKASPV